MLIIGGDFHPGFQQVAIFDNPTGEVQEKGWGTRRSRAVTPISERSFEMDRKFTKTGLPH